MQIMLFLYSFSFSVHCMQLATVPSEHSVAPEIWTDILGAFSQEHSEQ